MGTRRSAHDTFIDVHLTGRISTRIVGIGSGAVRLGDVTLMVGDRTAAPCLGLASIVLQDVAPFLGRRAPDQSVPHVSSNIVTACVTLNGRQLIRDFEAVPARSSADRCGFARFTLGSLRLTVHDLDAAERAAEALVDGYQVAQQAMGVLPDISQLRDARDARREARIQRRPHMISTPGTGLLAPAPPRPDHRGHERVL